MKLLSTTLLAVLVIAGSALAGCQKPEPVPPMAPSDSSGATGAMPPASAASR